VVSRGLRWSHVVSRGLTWSQVVSRGLAWSHVVSGGLTLSHVVSRGLTGGRGLQSAPLGGHDRCQPRAPSPQLDLIGRVVCCWSTAASHGVAQHKDSGPLQGPRPRKKEVFEQ